MHGTSASRAYDASPAKSRPQTIARPRPRERGKEWNEQFPGLPVRPSKGRCIGFDGLAGWLDRDAGGNRAIGVNDRKLFSIFTALQIERLDRLVVGAIDTNHLART